MQIKHINIILLVIILCMLGGCKKKGFDSEKSAERFIIQNMEEKYNEKFEILKVV